MINNLEYECNNILLLNKNKEGIINYKEISKININKFLNDNKYYTSDNLWNICLSKYKDNFIKELYFLEQKFYIDKKDILRILRKQFQYRIYEASIIEAICIYNINKSKDYTLLKTSDEDDYKNKIDIRFINKHTQINFHLQIKKWNKTKFNKNKIKREKEIQKEIFGSEAIYFEIDFKENNPSKRKLFYNTKIIDFSYSDGKDDNFFKNFIDLLNYIHTEKIEKILDYYLN